MVSNLLLILLLLPTLHPTHHPRGNLLASVPPGPAQSWNLTVRYNRAVLTDAFPVILVPRPAPRMYAVPRGLLRMPASMFFSFSVFLLFFFHSSPGKYPPCCYCWPHLMIAKVTLVTGVF
jgi:hypothetical protein